MRFALRSLERTVLAALTHVKHCGVSLRSTKSMCPVERSKELEANGHARTRTRKTLTFKRQIVIR